MRSLITAGIIAICTVLIHDNATAQQNWPQDSIHIQGNYTFVLHKSKVYNTYDILDPITNEKVLTNILPIYVPVTVNGVIIEQEKAPYYSGNKLQKTIEKQVIDKLKGYKLNTDGGALVMLRHVVVDEKGNLVYAGYSYDMYHSVDKMWRLLTECVTKDMVEDALKTLHWSSANKYTMLHTDLDRVVFRIKDDKINVVPAY